MTGAESGSAAVVPALRQRAIGALLRAQLCVFGGLAVCLLVRPEGWDANSGMSYFGVQWDTVWWYAAGLLGGAWFTRQGLRVAAAAMPKPATVRVMADGFALLVVGVIVTPYSVGTAVDWTHRSFGAALFVLQLILTIRLVRWTRDLAAGLLLGLQLAGGVASAVYVLAASGYLLETQLVFQAGFYLLVTRTVGLLSRRGSSQG